MLQAVFGLDIDAISSFTAYGRGEADKGIFAVKGGFDAERLQPHLPASVARQQASLAQRLRDALRSGASNEIFEAVQQCFRR